MGKKTLELQQLDRKMQAIARLKAVAMPPTGWIRATRIALGMSMQQLGNRLSVTKQSILEIEKREKDGTLTLKLLKETAGALDMQLVYGFVPNDGSLDALIERKAKALAEKIVMRTSNSMKLEDQENTDDRIKNAINESMERIKSTMPKILWD